MNKKNIILLLFLSLLLSCSESFLDIPNPNQMGTDQFWKTAEDLQKGIDAAYRPLRFNGEYGRWLYVLYVSRSDEGYCVSPNPYFQSYSNFKPMNDGNSEGILFPWLDLYKGVFWANQVLDNAPDIEMDNEAKERIIGQAYFLRGIQYFHIGAIWHRGPLILTSYSTDKGTIEEQPAFYERTRLDMIEAAKRLPVTWEKATDLGRITKGAALGMLAKVYAQERNWGKLEETCREIFDLKKYSLVNNYRDNFTITNENNSESVFEIQFAAGTQNGIPLGTQMSKFFGLPIPGGAWDDATASKIVKTDLEKEKTTDGKIDPRLKVTLFYYDAENPDEKFYGKTWNDWDLNRNKVYWKKFTNWDTMPGEEWNSGINLRVIRLSDIYLMYAEALNELNRTAEAYEYINRVRLRVGLPKLENSSVFTGIVNDKDKMRKQIIHERSCELAEEGWRWLDLERWGYLDSAEGISFLKSRDYEFDNYRIGVSNRYPIPVREVRLTSGLEQNPGF